MKKTYAQLKEEAREEAKEWQREFANSDHSYMELADTYNYFEAKAKKYGLIREFKENGIL